MSRPIASLSPIESFGTTLWHAYNIQCSSVTVMLQISGMQVFFVLDTGYCQTESDDLRDAIIYYYPQQIPITQACALFGQLFGVVQFYEANFTFPKLIRLDKGKFAMKKWGKYLLGLGGSSDSCDNKITSSLDHMCDLFSFYYLDMDTFIATREDISHVWSQLLKSVKRDCKGAPSTFVLTRPTNLPIDVYLSSSHLLQSYQRTGYALAGALFYKQHLICTQLPRRLTFYLSHHHGDTMAKVYLKKSDIDYLNSNGGIPADCYRNNGGNSFSDAELSCEEPEVDSSFEEERSTNRLSDRWSSNFEPIVRSELNEIYDVAEQSLQKLNIYMRKPTKRLRPKKLRKFLTSSVPNLRQNSDTSADSSFFEQKYVLSDNTNETEFISNWEAVSPNYMGKQCPIVIDDVVPTKVPIPSSINTVIDSGPIQLNLRLVKYSDVKLFLLTETEEKCDRDTAKDILIEIDSALKRLENVVETNETEPKLNSIACDNLFNVIAGDKLRKSFIVMDEFSQLPDLKSLTIQTETGVKYAHSSLTHNVYGEDDSGGQAGIPTPKDSIAKISQLSSKGRYNKMGYYLLN